MVEVRKPPLEGLRVIELAGLAPGIIDAIVTIAENELDLTESSSFCRSTACRLWRLSPPN